MDSIPITAEAVSAQTQARVRSEIGVRVFKEALNAQSNAALQLIQMMDQNAGLGNAVHSVV